MKSRSLKSILLASLALVATAFAFAPASAKADHSRYAGRCGSCNSAIYQQQVFTGCYDHCGHPIYRWVTVSHSCRSNYDRYRSQSYRDYGYRSSSSYGYRSYGYPSSGLSISIFGGGSRSSHHSHCR